jgi:hypothetical protein
MTDDPIEQTCSAPSKTMDKWKPYCGELTAMQAASVMQAARMNALDLMDSGD